MGGDTEKPSQQTSSREPRRRGRAQRPFDETTAAHTVVRAAESLGWDLSDPEAFLRHVQHVEYGLSAEIEFAALLRWLGTCIFVHRLSEDALADPSRAEWQVPDLFAVFSIDRETCSALIEVKTTGNHVLKFKKAYMERLQAYARLLNQPLLIAWHPRNIGFWILIDPSHAEAIDGETLQLDFEVAIQNDLMSLLAGDFFIVPKKGVGFRFEAKRISDKEPTKDGYEAVFQIDKAYFQDATGNAVENVPESIIWMTFSAMEEKQDVTDEGFVQSFLTSGGMTRAQMVLRTAASFPLREDQRIHWKAVGTNLEAILACDALLSNAQAHFGTFVQYIFHQQPQIMPDFLPNKWRATATVKDRE